MFVIPSEAEGPAVERAFLGGYCGASPGLQSGGAGFQTRGNARYINFGALALVAASRAILARTCLIEKRSGFSR